MKNKIALGLLSILMITSVGAYADNGGAIIGGLVGGLIGNTVGKGNGRLAAIAVGSTIGAITGKNLSDRGYQEQYPSYNSSYHQPQQVVYRNVYHQTPVYQAPQQVVIYNPSTITYRYDQYAYDNERRQERHEFRHFKRDGDFDNYRDNHRWGEY